MQFDHLTLRTRDLSSAKVFFEQVFDLTEGSRPSVIRNIPGHWLYADDKPVVHLVGSSRGAHVRSDEAIDHVGIRPNGSYKDFKARLETLAITYSLMDVFELQERRIFFRTPGGPLLEAVFNEPVAKEFPPLEYAA